MSLPLLGSFPPIKGSSRGLKGKGSKDYGKEKSGKKEGTQGGNLCGSGGMWSVTPSRVPKRKKKKKKEIDGRATPSAKNHRRIKEEKPVGRKRTEGESRIIVRHRVKERGF